MTWYFCGSKRSAGSSCESRETTTGCSIVDGRSKPRAAAGCTWLQWLESCELICELICELCCEPMCELICEPDCEPCCEPCCELSCEFSCERCCCLTDDDGVPVAILRKVSARGWPPSAARGTI